MKLRFFLQQNLNSKKKRQILVFLDYSLLLESFYLFIRFGNKAHFLILLAVY